MYPHVHGDSVVAFSCRWASSLPWLVSNLFDCFIVCTFFVQSGFSGVCCTYLLTAARDFFAESGSVFMSYEWIWTDQSKIKSNSVSLSFFCLRKEAYLNFALLYSMLKFWKNFQKLLMTFKMSSSSLDTVLVKVVLGRANWRALKQQNYWKPIFLKHVYHLWS